MSPPSPWSSDGDGDSGDREDAADEDELGSKRDGDDLLTDVITKLLAVVM